MREKEIKREEDEDPTKDSSIVFELSTLLYPCRNALLSSDLDSSFIVVLKYSPPNPV